VRDVHCEQVGWTEVGEESLDAGRGRDFISIVHQIPDCVDMCLPSVVECGCKLDSDQYDSLVAHRAYARYVPWRPHLWRAHIQPGRDGGARERVSLVDW
jgi:hypothetical protein